jgi:DNA replication protein DnaD
LISYLGSSQKTALQEKFIDLFCSSSYFLGISCLVELFLSCWPFLDDDITVSSLSRLSPDLSLNNNQNGDNGEGHQTLKGLGRKTGNSANYSKLSSFFASFSAVSPSSACSTSSIYNSNHLFANLQSRYASLLSTISSAGQSSSSLISKHHFQQQLISVISLGMLLKDQLKPVLWLFSSTSSTSSSSLNNQSLSQFNLLSLITSCYQLDSTAIRKSLSVSVQRYPWPVPSSSTLPFKFSLLYKDCESCSPFPWEIFQRMKSSGKPQRIHTSSSFPENDEKTIEFLLRKLAFLLMKHSSFSAMSELISILNKKVHKLIKTLHEILQHGVAKFKEEEDQQVEEQKATEEEKQPSNENGFLRDSHSSVKNEELTFEFDFIISCLNFLQNGIFGIMKYKLITASYMKGKEHHNDAAKLVKKPNYATVCNYCQKFFSSSTLLRCSKCKSVCYCSKEHQFADWQAHKVNLPFPCIFIFIFCFCFLLETLLKSEEASWHIP